MDLNLKDLKDLEEYRDPTKRVAEMTNSEVLQTLQDTAVYLATSGAVDSPNWRRQQALLVAARVELRIRIEAKTGGKR